MRILPLALSCLAPAFAALAAPVAFDNSAGQFVQNWYGNAQFGAIAGTCFDITKPPTAQPIPPPGQECAAGTFDIVLSLPHPNSTPGSIRTSGYAVTMQEGPNAFLSPIPRPLMIGAAMGQAQVISGATLAHLRDPSASTPPTQYAFTDGGAVGVKFTIQGATHYGWIRYAYTESPPNPTVVSRWQPVEWAYDALPGAPIRVNTYACTIAGDFTADGVTNFSDLNAVLATFGTQYSFMDLNTVLSNFGQSCR